MQRFDDVAAAAQGLMVLMEFGLWLSLLQNVDGKVQVSKYNGPVRLQRDEGDPDNTDRAEGVIQTSILKFVLK